MRPPVNIARLHSFMASMGQRIKDSGRIYLTGGATALLHGWREMTVDIDLRADPEPAGLFEAIATLKDELEINVELACLSDFIPELPGWRERSPLIGRFNRLDFYHYDPYSQALSKLERGHARDLDDVQAMVGAGLVRPERLLSLFQEIEPSLLRYPAIDPPSFRLAVNRFHSGQTRKTTTNDEP